MSLWLTHIVIDCADPPALAGFWSAALARPVDDRTGKFFASIDDHVADRPSWFFIKVPEDKQGKNRLHVDLCADDRVAEVERLVELGATAISGARRMGRGVDGAGRPGGQRVLRRATPGIGLTPATTIVQWAGSTSEHE
ncbi:MAG: VOC family protein [Mycobacteriales bacterium]